ncbi:probable WRKY transcription factor protein 1, partial [Rhagoletis pomonella]|uniref:probable WRKY transcription factor protein 1 n=1 Tax=Rhagoletis pomonella TaxID=28610 RepID=UPI0017875042
APVCSTNTMIVIGASLEEAVPIPCRVNSDPPEIDFEWTFSTSGEHFEVPSGHYATIQEATTTGDVHRTIIEANDTHFETYVETVSELIYTPKGERDYGTLACWGQNSIGKQSEPCLFQVVPAAKPGALRNCTLRPYVVTSASLNSSNQTTMHGNQMVPAQYGRHESNFPHMEYVRERNNNNSNNNKNGNKIHNSDGSGNNKASSTSKTNNKISSILNKQQQQQQRKNNANTLIGQQQQKLHHQQQKHRPPQVNEQQQRQQLQRLKERTSFTPSQTLAAIKRQQQQQQQLQRQQQQQKHNKETSSSSAAAAAVAAEASAVAGADINKKLLAAATRKPATLQGTDAAGNLATMAYINNKTDGLPTKMRVDSKHRVKRAADEHATTAKQHNKNTSSKHKQKKKIHKETASVKELQLQHSRKLTSKQTQKMKMNVSNKRQKSNLSLPTVGDEAAAVVGNGRNVQANNKGNNKQTPATKYYNWRRKNTHKREVAPVMSEVIHHSTVMATAMPTATAISKETEKEANEVSVDDEAAKVHEELRLTKREAGSIVANEYEQHATYKGEISADLAPVKVFETAATNDNNTITLSSSTFGPPIGNFINSKANNQTHQQNVQQRSQIELQHESAPPLIATDDIAASATSSIDKVRIRKSLTAKNVGATARVSSSSSSINADGKSEHHFSQYSKVSHHDNNFTQNFNKVNNNNATPSAPTSALQISNHAVAFHHQKQQQYEQGQQRTTNGNRGIDVIGMQRAINDLASSSDESDRAAEIFGNKFAYEDDGDEIDMPADEVAVGADGMDKESDGEVDVNTAEAGAGVEADIDADETGDGEDAELNSFIEVDEELSPPTLSALRSEFRLPSADIADAADGPHFDYSRMEYSFSNGIATHSLVGSNGNGHGLGLDGISNGNGIGGGGGGGTINLENYDNIVYSTMELECMPGYDGGLQQQFFLEAYDSKTKKLRLNTTSTYADIPIFRIDLSDLTSMDYYPDANPALHLVVYSANQKGRSEPIVLENIPINEAEKRQDGRIASILPLAALLTGTLFTVGIAVLFVVVIAVRKRRCQGGRNLCDDKDKHLGMDVTVTAPLETGAGHQRLVVAYTLKQGIEKQPDILNAQKSTTGIETSSPLGNRPGGLYLAGSGPAGSNCGVAGNKSNFTTVASTNATADYDTAAISYNDPGSTNDPLNSPPSQSSTLKLGSEVRKNYQSPQQPLLYDALPLSRHDISRYDPLGLNYGGSNSTLNSAGSAGTASNNINNTPTAGTTSHSLMQNNLSNGHYVNHHTLPHPSVTAANSSLHHLQQQQQQQ